MAHYIKVSTQRIKQDKESILGEMEGIADVIEELYQEMQALGQTWEGPAWHTFQTQVASDIENMKAVNEKMSGYISHIENAEEQYKRCEGEVKQIVSSIWI